jgi:hypothetical protein
MNDSDRKTPKYESEERKCTLADLSLILSLYTNSIK